MIRLIVMTIFVGAFAIAPVYLLDHYVLPELAALKEAYGNVETMTDNMTDRMTDTMTTNIAPLR
jgi:hypothetical protein